MAGISSKAVGKKENRFKFNEGTERTTDLELNWDETAYRSYDGQIGRFHQIDQLLEISHSSSPFSYVQNNPILFNDPFGLDTVRTGTANGSNSASATNKDGTQGNYVVDPNNPNQLLGVGMSGESQVTVKSTRNYSSGIVPNGLWLISGAREWYAGSAIALKSKFTSSNGLIDYAGGSAARTELKFLLRNYATPYPIKSFLDKNYPIVNKYNPVTNPNPSFWKTNRWVTRSTRILGLASIAFDIYGISTNSISTSDFILNTGTNGAITFGGTVGFGAGFYFTIGRSAYSFYDNQFQSMSTNEQFKFVNTQMMSGTQFIGH
jgi:RHS repeat-associated protein